MRVNLDGWATEILKGLIIYGSTRNTRCPADHLPHGMNFIHVILVDMQIKIEGTSCNKYMDQVFHCSE